VLGEGYRGRETAPLGGWKKGPHAGGGAMHAVQPAR
jgi:hypothetical protein